MKLPSCLEELSLDCTDRYATHRRRSFPPITLLPLTPQDLDPSFAIWLRNLPQLHIIRYFSKPEIYQNQCYASDYACEGSDSDDDDYSLITAWLCRSAINTNVVQGISKQNKDNIIKDQDILFSTNTSFIPDTNLSEESQKITCRIFSIRHGDEEILHGRLFAHDCIIDGKEKGSMLCCHGEGVIESVIQQSPTWRYFCDWNGLAVPAGVLQKMRYIEGLSVGEWEKRGVRVSEGTWKFLCEWRERRKAADEMYEKNSKQLAEGVSG